MSEINSFLNFKPINFQQNKQSSTETNQNKQPSFFGNVSTQIQPMGSFFESFSMSISNFRPPELTSGNQSIYTTMAMGEEGGGMPPPPATTMAMGEEGGGTPQPPPAATTMAMGEEGGEAPQPQPTATTMALGEEGGEAPQPPPAATTMAVGEEGGEAPQPSPIITTMAMGEEGGEAPQPPPTITTMALGEEGGNVDGTAGPDQINISKDKIQTRGFAGDDLIKLHKTTGNHVEAGDGDDIITANGVKNTLLGGNGNDKIYMNLTNRALGGAGDDQVFIKNRNKNPDFTTYVSGGEGNDTVHLQGNAENYTVEKIPTNYGDDTYSEYTHKKSGAKIRINDDVENIEYGYKTNSVKEKPMHDDPTPPVPIANPDTVHPKDGPVDKPVNSLDKSMNSFFSSFTKIFELINKMFN